MKQSNKRRRSNRTKSTLPANKSVRNSRYFLVVLVIVLFFCIVAGLRILKKEHRVSKSPLHDYNSPSPISLITPQIEQSPLLAPLELSSLSVKEQVTKLREESVMLGQKLVADFPQQADSHVLLGNTYRQLGQSSQAVDCWNKALALDAQRADVYTYLAILAEEKEDAEQALSYWNKLLSLRPNLPGLRDSIANTLMSMNQWDNAIEILQEEMKLSPQSARTQYLLGRAYSQQNRFKEAANHYEKTITYDPNWTGAYYELATALTRSGQRQKAQHYLKLFKERKQQDKTGTTYGYTDQEDLAKAKKTLAGICAGAADLYQASRQDVMLLALLERIVILDPNNLGIRKRLAARYQALGRFPEALSECEQIARLAPDDHICQMLIGSLCMRIGHYTRAETAFKKMIALAPKLSTGYHELAKIYLKTRNNLLQAQILAQQAVQLDPTADNYYVLGLAHYENGDKSSAIEAIKQALQLDPGNQTYRMTYEQLISGK